MKYIYCPKCGRKLTDRKAGDDGKIPYCETCKKFWFDSFSDCTIVLVANELGEIALLRQGYLSDKYATFVSGYIKPGETAEETENVIFPDSPGNAQYALYKQYMRTLTREDDDNENNI